MRRAEMVLLVFSLLFAGVQDAAAVLVKKSCSVPNEVIYDLKVDEGDIQRAIPEDAVDANELNFDLPNGNCGRKSTLISTYHNSPLVVRLEKRKFSFIPIMISDKYRGEFYCYAVKIRSACVSQVIKTEEGFEVELKTDTTKTASSAVIRVARDGSTVYPAGDTQFFLMPYFQGHSPLPFPDKVSADVDKYSCSDHGNCAYEKAYFVEWRFIDRLRALRQIRLPAQETLSDWKKFSDAMIDQLSGTKRVIHEFTTKNEIGEDSPYALGDAVNADSGPSFGAYQIDIATDPNGAEIFKTIVLNSYKQSKDQPSARLSKAISAGDYEKPIREYRTTLLARLYADWPLINSALRSDFGVTHSNSAYVAYLERQARTFEGLKKSEQFIRVHPWAGFYLLDINNQYGGYKWAIPKFKSAARDASSDDDFRQKILDIMLSTKYGRDHPEDIKRRMPQVIDSVSKFYH
jgi:hypothetical protein